jgi:hypothetical protein
MVLEVLLICRLILGRFWQHYPYFFVYVAFFVAQTVALIAILRWAPAEYRTWYWGSGFANLGLRFFVVGEVYRHTFPANSSLRRMVSGGLTVVGMMVSTIVVAMLWGIEVYGKSHLWNLALERSFGFAQAVLILMILTVARYYHVPLGKNVWGIAIAFGMYSSVIIANSAFVDIAHSFLPYWQILAPFSSVMMLSIWLWCTWSYAPNPVVTAEEIAAQQADLSEWSQGWGQTVSTVRKVMNS